MAAACIRRRSRKLRWVRVVTGAAQARLETELKVAQATAPAPQVRVARRLAVKAEPTAEALEQRAAVAPAELAGPRLGALAAAALAAAAPAGAAPPGGSRGDRTGTPGARRHVSQRLQQLHERRLRHRLRCQLREQ